MLEELLYGWTDEEDPLRPANLDRLVYGQGDAPRRAPLERGASRIVDGSVWEWESEFDARQLWRKDSWFTEPKVLIAPRDAVMAGYRYVTSFNSTPRYLRAPMHEDLR